MALLAMVQPSKPADLATFLGQVLPAQGERWMLMARRGAQMVHESFDNIETMASRAMALDANGIEVWYACASFLYAPDACKPDGTKWGRKKENVAYLSSFFLDIDVSLRGDTKGYASFDDARAAVLQFADRFGVPFNYLVESGSGLHVYWFMDEDIPREQWEATANKFKNAVTLFGLRADPSRTADAASVMRPVGTTNRKPIHGEAGKVVKGQWCRYGRVAAAEFATACTQIAEREMRAKAEHSLGIAGHKQGNLLKGSLAHLSQAPKWFDALDPEAKPVVLRSLLASLPGAAVEDHLTWLKVGAALAGASGVESAQAFALWAEWSQSTEAGRHSWHVVTEAEQKQRWDSLTKSGVGSLIYMAKQAGWAPGALDSASGSDRARALVCESQETHVERWSLDEAQAYLNQHVTFVRGDNLYLVDGLPLSKEALDTSLARYMPQLDRTPTASGLFKKGFGKVVDFQGYKPGAGPVFMGDDGRKYANTWQDLPLLPQKPTVEDAMAFRDFVVHLSGVKQQTRVGIKRLFTKLAYLHNHPSARIRHATLIIGKHEGCGKSTATYAIPKAIFGSQNVRSVETRELSSDFNGYAHGVRILVLPELWLGTRKDALTQANNLKPLITDDYVPVVRKGKDGRSVQNFTTILASSNHIGATVFSERDRRYDVVVTEAKPMEQELAHRIYSLIENRPGSLLWLVLAFGSDAGEFNPNAPPPNTDDKRLIVQSTRAVWAERLRDAHEAGNWPFGGDAVAVSDARKYLQREFDRLPSDNAIRDELLNLGDGSYSTLAQRRRGGAPQQKRLVVLKNCEAWRLAGPTALFDHYELTVLHGLLGPVAANVTGSGQV